MECHIQSISRTYALNFGNWSETMPDDTLTDNLLGQQLDEYRLESMLGRGAMGCVYLGFDVRLERRAAVKVIDPSLRIDSTYAARFKREARAVACLKHPHIVGLYRYGEVDDILYMAMEYIEGHDLATVLADYQDEQKPILPGEASRIIRQLCLALDYAHSRGVIHRDIKPSNIMLDKQGNAILTDFGLVLLNHETTLGQVFGTPHYIAPEQAVSSAGAVPQSDLYALGVILYEMFSGTLPFDAAYPDEVARLHLEKPPPPPRTVNPDISPKLEAVILRALAKEPEDRYQTGAALADALAEALQPDKGQASAPAPLKEQQSYISIIWRANMSRKEDIKKLIVNHRRRLQKLKEQQALQGLAIDPKILLEIEDIETKIEELQTELERRVINEPLGRYRLITRLGQGAMGDVYQAYDSNLYRYVAVKILHSHLTNNEDFIERFQAEATMVAGLRHPNIVQVYDFASAEDQYYMVMEFIEGATLRAELKNRQTEDRPFSLEKTSHIVKDLAKAIDYAHAKGIIHRDLKPANIMFTGDGQVVLTDFGIARILGAVGHTVTGRVMGTPAYISPEQAQGEPADERSDIYSLGVILYQMAAGRVPYEAELPLEVMMQHLNSNLRPPREINPDLPPAVEQVILKVLRKNPDERYQTATELAQALEQAISPAAELQETETTPPESNDACEQPQTVEREPAPSLTPSQRRRLEQKRERLETQLETLSEKINALHRDLTLENRSDEQMRLQAVIKNNEKLQAQFEAKLDNIEGQLG